jgi:phage recombination protein Bet
MGGEKDATRAMVPVAGQQGGLAKRASVPEVPELTLEIVKKFINPKVTDAEAFMFLSLCKAQQLDPFKKEIYLIKYGTQDASMVTSKDTFAKRAERNAHYRGFRAGLILLNNAKEIVYREGSFALEGEMVFGGWCEVIRDDRSAPIRNEVSVKEYEGKKADGTVTKMWAEKPATMIRKVAFCQSHREAFPDELGHLYGFEEMGGSETEAPTYEYGKDPVIPVSPELRDFAAPKEKAAAPAGTAAGATVDTTAVAVEDGGKAANGGTVEGNGKPMFDVGCARAGVAQRQNMSGDVGSANEKQIGKVNVVLNKLGWKTDEERHLAVGQMLGLGPFKTLKDLSMREASAVIDVLVELEKKAAAK